MLPLLNDNWFSSLIGIVGLLAALFFFIRSKVRARPSCLIRTLPLLGREEQSLPAEVGVYFNERPVPRVNLTHVYFWNAGNATLDGSSIVPGDPIRLKFPEETSDAFVLKARVASTTRPVTNFSVSTESSGEVSLSFDFLDANDGALVEILHCSKSSTPELIGTLRGLPEGVRLFFNERRTFWDETVAMMSKGWQRRFLMTCITIFGIGLILLGVLPPDTFIKTPTVSTAVSHVANDPLDFPIVRITVAIFGIPYALLPVIEFLSRRKKYPAVLDVKAQIS